MIWWIAVGVAVLLLGVGVVGGSVLGRMIREADRAELGL